MMSDYLKDFALYFGKTVYGGKLLKSYWPFERPIWPYRDLFLDVLSL